MTSARVAPHGRPRLLVPASSMLLFVAMISSFTPTPLYPLYQEEWSISDALIAVAFIGYPVGVIITLVLLGSSVHMRSAGSSIQYSFTKTMASPTRP